jgi:UTP--glucose-1-phosphate uridylyltransferase
MTLRKAVFPVAGLGTRFLPATKAIPKEMLPVADKPLIQYAVEEAAGAGFSEFIFVTGRGKEAVADHFDRAPELEAELAARNKQAQLAGVCNVLPDGGGCVYVRQAQALGLGHAVLCAEQAVGGEPFAVLLPDDLIDGGSTSALQQIAAIHGQRGASVIAVETVPRSDTDKYGIVAVEGVADRLYRIREIVEKPQPDRAPSTLAVVGRYILSPRIFALLKTTGRGAGGEIQLTDAIALLLKEEPVYACEFEGRRFDCGTKLGYLQANVAYGLRHPEIGRDFAEYLKNLSAE